MTQRTLDFTTFHSRLRLVGTLELETSLRIGAGRASDAAQPDLPVVKDSLGRPYIPGSSFKGAFRAHLERLLRTIEANTPRAGDGPVLACESVSKDDQAPDYPGCLTAEMVKVIKREYEDRTKRPKLLERLGYGRDADVTLDRILLDQSCWVCSVFGAPWLASKVWFKDLTVSNWHGHYQMRDGVSINRDTGTAEPQKVYDFEAVPAGVEFEFEMVLENTTPAEQGMIILALRDFEQGRVLLGGGRSRGLGCVRLRVDWEKAEYVDGAHILATLLTEEGEPPAPENNFSDPKVRQERILTFLREIGVPLSEEGKEEGDA